MSDKTRANAEALARFNATVKADIEAGTHRGLMMPVRDGMLAVTRCGSAYPTFLNIIDAPPLPSSAASA